MTDLPGAGGRVVAARDLRPAVVPGHSFRVLADAAGADGALGTGGAFSLTEAESPKGAGVPPHAHDGSVECFYVQDGAYRLTVSGTSHELGPGGFLLVPRGASHQFEVLEGQAAALVLFAPAGFEEVFRQMPEVFGTPGEPGPLWGEVNARADTRLLHSDVHDDAGAGPAALVRPGGAADAAAPRSLTLADSAATGTELRIRLRDGDSAGIEWTPGASATAVYVLAGRYRFDLPGGELEVGAGEYLALPGVAGAGGVAGAAGAPGATGVTRARALVAGSRALLLHLGD
ncbi:cupin domain-containing protein [Streptacidiphilus sp. PAMC 29251]